MTEKFGEATITCTVASAAKSLCLGADDFGRRGQIMAQVLSLHPLDFDGAIVGGTGEFAGASGVLQVRDISGHDERVTFELD